MARTSIAAMASAAEVKTKPGGLYWKFLDDSKIAPIARGIGIVTLLSLGCRSSREEKPVTAAQLTGATFIVEALASTGAVREWEQPKSIVVDASFEGMSLEQQENACRALDVVRRTKGLKSGFDLRDATHHHKIGRYRNGTLDLK